MRIGADHPLDELTGDDLQFAQGLRMTPEVAAEVARRLSGGPGDLLLLLAGPDREINPPLSALRNEMGARLELADPDTLAFAFVRDFPLFEWHEESGRWESSHHPFTSPADEFVDLVYSGNLDATAGPGPGEVGLGSIKSRAYDLVCNGSELASGSIRVHRRDLQERIFQVLGYTTEDVRERFGHLLEALEFGAPPHGGIAPGIDRLVAILADAPSIRGRHRFSQDPEWIRPVIRSAVARGRRPAPASWGWAWWSDGPAMRRIAEGFGAWEKLFTN